MNNPKKKISYLPVSALELDPELPRKSFREEKIKEMSDSIKEKGILQPLLVRQKKDESGKYSVVIGKMRLRSATLAGCAEIPCVIENVDDKEALELALIENMQRDDLMPFEEAWGIVKLMKNYGYSIEEVTKKIGKGHKFVNMRLQLLSLPEEIQKYVAENKLGISEVVPLVNLTPQKQLELAQELASATLSRDQIRERILKKIKESKKLVNKEGDIFRKIKLGVENLTKLLETLNSHKMPYKERQGVKVQLSRLRKVIDEIIAEIKKI